MTAATATDMATDRRIGRAWIWFTTATMWVIFLQSITAGRILSGDDWARTAHSTTAWLLFLAVLGAGVAASARLGARAGGRRLGVLLLALAACLFVQSGLGAAAAEGKDTLWLHVPFGVATILFAAQAALIARRLGSGASR